MFNMPQKHQSQKETNEGEDTQIIFCTDKISTQNITKQATTMYPYPVQQSDIEDNEINN
jgi:hypothetical protein